MGSRRFFRQRTGSLDANHLAIRDGLRKLGHFVQDLAGVGGGCPDLFVLARIDWDAPMSTEQRLAQLANGARSIWLELKVAKGKLRKSQLDWRLRAELRGIRVATVRSLAEALTALEAA